ncbi:glyceraldehyde-3-phosphate dehydrogenase-like [Apodemus sylvaticus]|uniref:glyceraldehyde-3-phosphate dehydrogenase-like n=1 Tax=Apodemus sylvaticus TaxID=10129 RepID=UPI002244C99E|nr:glyceraldehyde-3-phosphate dehydrogenase-like [Apodemus sylvaticus]
MKPQAPALPCSRDSLNFCAVSVSSHRHYCKGWSEQICLYWAPECSASIKVEIVDINDPFIDLNYMVYMFQYDATHGKFNSTVKAENGKLVINRKAITILHEQDPNIKCGDAGAKYIVKSTGVFTIMKNARGHLNGGTKMVIISTSSANVFDVHIITATQKTVNGPTGKLWYDDCEAVQNIIPSSTGAAKAVGEVIPELSGKFTAIAFCVPTHNVSIVDLTCCLKKPTKYDDIKKVVKQASEGSLKDILGYTEDQVVSCDFNSNSHSSTFYAGACTALNDSCVKLISWYDNGFGYRNMVVDLMAT